MRNDIISNQVLVRFGGSDDQTRAVIDGVQREGACRAGGSLSKGQAVMRISVSNGSTTEEDINRSAEAILRIHQDLLE